jgi:signal transduction histidine kinase
MKLDFVVGMPQATQVPCDDPNPATPGQPIVSALSPQIASLLNKGGSRTDRRWFRMRETLPSSIMHLPHVVRTSTLRSSFAIASVFVLCTLLLFGFIYWRTAAYIMSMNDVLLIDELGVFSANTPERRLQEIDDRLRKDPRRIKIAGLFGANGHRIAGNIESLPSGLVPDVPTNAAVVRADASGRETQNVRLATHPLTNGDVLVIGRNIDELAKMAQIVGWALVLGLVLAFGLAVAIGMVLSVRAHERLLEVNRKIQRIVAGDLRQRLPTHGRDDSFDELALSVNRMLGDIETLVHEVAGVGDNIAHDLRTPLTRVRLRLERGRERAATLDELRAVTDQAIAGLDQSLSIITALLRIAEIEHSRRLDGFDCVALGPLIHEVRDLYDPIAEDKGISLRVDADDGTIVHGDRDLLFEAVANLVNNAVKFTPAGGCVELALLRRGTETIIRVRDTGPGIPEIEREAVTRRFYRSDKNHRTEGLGLGLSLVAAIVKLHRFSFSFATGPGCTVEIACSQGC